jgi:hypothetical protein
MNLLGFSKFSFSFKILVFLDGGHHVVIPLQFALNPFSNYLVIYIPRDKNLLPKNKKKNTYNKDQETEVTRSPYLLNYYPTPSKLLKLLSHAM